MIGVGYKISKNVKKQDLVYKLRSDRLQTSNQKSNLHYIRRITPKRVTSGGGHLRDLARGLHNSEETWQRWRAVGDTVSI